MRSRGMTAGRIDGRFAGYTYDLLTESAESDPEGPAVGGAFTALINQYNHEELKFGQDRPYRNTKLGWRLAMDLVAVRFRAASPPRRTHRKRSRRR